MHSFARLILGLVAEEKLIVFDLDDTLISERLWLRAGWNAVGFQAAGGDEALARRLATWLERDFDQHGRSGLFNRMSTAFPAIREDMENWLRVFRNAEVPGGLSLVGWVREVCLESKPVFPILTNGNVCQQREKYRQLEPAPLQPRFRLFCAAEHVPKPSPQGLQVILGTLGHSPESAVFVGDSEVDAECAERAGIRFIQAPPVP